VALVAVATDHFVISVGKLALLHDARALDAALFFAQTAINDEALTLCASPTVGTLALLFSIPAVLAVPARLIRVWNGLVANMTGIITHCCREKCVKP